MKTKTRAATWSILTLLSWALLACPGQPPAPSAPSPLAPVEGLAVESAPADFPTTTLAVAGLAFAIPESWQARKPGTSMRLAEYALPGSGGEAELLVFVFPPGQGGDRAANVERWLGQFTDSAGGTPFARTTSMEVNGLKVTIVEAEGTYRPTAGPMAPPADPRPDHALFGIIVEGGREGNVFVKVTGPKTTMAEQRQNLSACAASARKAP